jgi:hypothetical protein
MGKLKDSWKQATSQFDTILPKDSRTPLFPQVQGLQDCLKQVKEIEGALSTIDSNSGKKHPTELEKLTRSQESLKTVYERVKAARNKDPKGNLDRGLKLLMKQLDAIVATIKADYQAAAAPNKTGSPAEKNLKVFKFKMKKEIADGLAWVALAKSVVTALEKKKYPSTVDIPNTEWQKIGSGPSTDITLLINDYEASLKKFPSAYAEAVEAKNAINNWEQNFRKLRTIEQIKESTDKLKSELKEIIKWSTDLLV